jgi:hypothetical protein
MTVANGLARPPRKRVSFVATKTEIVRNEHGQDETLKAGQTYVHDDAHFLVLTYPHLFKRTDGRPMRQRSRPARQEARTPAPRPARKLERTLARRPRPRWNPLVRLDPLSAPTFTVQLSQGAYLSMTDQAFTQRGNVETGGALFGIPAGERDDAVKVKQAADPGPRSRSSHGSMHVDCDHIRAEAVDRERRGALARWVGHWHTHPVIGSGQPSERDLMFFAWDCRELHRMGRSMDHYIGLILTPNYDTNRSTHEPYVSWAKPTLHAWHMHPVSDDQFICTRANVERLR